MTTTINTFITSHRKYRNFLGGGGCKTLGFPGGSVVKNLLPVQEIKETWVQSLGREDPLEDKMATHSSILACKIPWTEEPGRLQSMGLQRVEHD